MPHSNNIYRHWGLGTTCSGQSYPAGPTPYHISGKGLILGTDTVHGQHLFDISYCIDKELRSKSARAKLVLHGGSSSSSTLQHNYCSLHSILLHNSCFENLGVEIWVAWLTLSCNGLSSVTHSISCMVRLSVVWLTVRGAQLVCLEWLTELQSVFSVTHTKSWRVESLYCDSQSCTIGVYFDSQ